jgi:hypothetical protein
MSKIKNCYLVSREGEEIGNEKELANLDGYAILPVENLFQLVVKRDDFPEMDKQNLAMIIRRLFKSGRLKAKY